MTAITFDTLKFVERLKHSGISEKQAKAISEAFKDAQFEAEVATKSDLRELEYRMIIKFGMMLTVAIGIIVTLQKIL